MNRNEKTVMEEWRKHQNTCKECVFGPVDKLCPQGAEIVERWQRVQFLTMRYRPDRPNKGPSGVLVKHKDLTGRRRKDK